MNRDRLEIELKRIGLNPNQDQLDTLELYMHETLETNKYFNLTAIKEEDKFRELMIFDSAYPLKYYNLDDKKIIDVGTGAGYPGTVLAALSNGRFTLLDSTSKKVKFTSISCSKFRISNVNCVCARAELYAKEHRDEYDFAVARAVSELGILIEMIIPMLKVNGCFIALKGTKAHEEIENAKKILDRIGAEIIQIDEYELPESKEKRTNIIIKKTKPTNTKYPRKYSQIINGLK